MCTIESHNGLDVIEIKDLHVNHLSKFLNTTNITIIHLHLLQIHQHNTNIFSY